jgi:hypothetical protein
VNPGLLVSAPGRIYRFMSAIAVLGVMISWLRFGTQVGIGFAVGAAISFLNFWSFLRIVQRTGQPMEGGGTAKTSTGFLGFRYLLFGTAAYVIISLSDAHLLAVLTGLFVCVAAVVIEIIYELIYART